MFRAIVLGAAAGGGFPQWNSNAPACRRARAGDSAAKARTQASLAVSADRINWFVLNASPDLRQQIEATAALQPRSGLRSSPIQGVFLTSAEVDAIAGLLHLRERQAFTIYATDRTLAVLDANPIFRALAPDCVRRQAVPLDQAFEPGCVDGTPAGFQAELFPVPGKVPLYLETAATPEALAGEPGDNVGIEIALPRPAGGAARLLFVPGCAAMTPALVRRLGGADVVLFDGTLWTDDEMLRLGLGGKTGRRMGHLSVSGSDGAMAALQGLGVKRRVFIHINNSNPILLADSPERQAVAAAGWEVAHDGMEIAL